jgi:hypothetical protein
MSAKMIAVWYPQNVVARSGRQEIVVIDDVSVIKNKFTELLFNRYANYILVNYENKMYVIEPVDRNKYLYTRRAVGYHPLKHKVD